eukprot:m.67208 g.67208  ORF g.67208 m.67208 type:complete len:880 (+) comp13810_c0_seq1:124-2763(+)
MARRVTVRGAHANESTTDPDDGRLGRSTPLRTSGRQQQQQQHRSGIVVRHGGSVVPSSPRTPTGATPGAWQDEQFVTPFTSRRGGSSSRAQTPVSPTGSANRNTNPNDHSQRSNHSATTTPTPARARSVLRRPPYTSPQQKAPGFLLDRLRPSVGQLLPEFTPTHHLYTLDVPETTESVRFSAKSKKGKVTIDKQDKHTVVGLLPPGHGPQKVVITVHPPPSDAEHFVSTEPLDYVIDVWRGGRPTNTGGGAGSTSSDADMGMDTDLDAVSEGSLTLSDDDISGDGGGKPDTSRHRRGRRRRHRVQPQVPQQQQQPSRSQSHSLLHPQQQHAVHRVQDPVDERYVATHPFFAQGPNELSLDPGEELIVVLKSDSGWWAGFRALDPQVQGWFPAHSVRRASPSPGNRMATSRSPAPSGMNDTVLHPSSSGVYHHHQQQQQLPPLRTSRPRPGSLPPQFETRFDERLYESIGSTPRPQRDPRIQSLPYPLPPNMYQEPQDRLYPQREQQDHQEQHYGNDATATREDEDTWATWHTTLQTTAGGFASPSKAPDAGRQEWFALHGRNAHPHAKPFTQVLYFPFLTVALVVLQFIMFIAAVGDGGFASMEVNPMAGADFDTLKRLGGRWFPEMDDGGLYLSFTALFLPVGLIRLLLDCVLFWQFSALFEREHGSLSLAFVYFASGLTGHMAGALFLPRWLGTGPAPALMGVVGALVVTAGLAAWQQRGVSPRWPHPAVWLALVFLTLLFGAFPGQDNWSQVVGFFAGALASLCVLGRDSALHYLRTMPGGTVTAAGSSASAVHQQQQHLVARIEEHRRLARRSTVLATAALVGVLLVLLLFCILLFTAGSTSSPCQFCMDSTCFDAHNWCDETTRLGAPATIFA